MGSGVRVDVKIDAPDGCPVTRVSGAAGTPCTTITKSVTSGAPGRVTEEFVLDAGGDGSFDPDGPTVDVELDEVFSYESKRVFRFGREQGWGCPCECVERFDCPLVDVHAEDGSLFLSFHAPDTDTLQDVIRSLRDRYPDTDVQRLLRSNGDRTEDSLVLVDRGALTARQREVLETAHDLGYFEHPKGANAGEVADALGITTSTVTEHLAAAQRKLLTAIIDA